MVLIQFVSTVEGRLAPTTTSPGWVLPQSTDRRRIHGATRARYAAASKVGSYRQSGPCYTPGHQVDGRYHSQQQRHAAQQPPAAAASRALASAVTIVYAPAIPKKAATPGKNLNRVHTPAKVVAR